MTIRERLNHRMGWLQGALLLTFVVLIADGLLEAQPNPVIFVLGFIVFTGINLVAYTVGFRCGQCNGNLATLFFAHRKLFARDSQVHFCPFCGSSLNESPVG